MQECSCGFTYANEAEFDLYHDNESCYETALLDEAKALEMLFSAADFIRSLGTREAPDAPWDGLTFEAILLLSKPAVELSKVVR